MKLLSTDNVETVIKGL